MLQSLLSMTVLLSTLAIPAYALAADQTASPVAEPVATAPVAPAQTTVEAASAVAATPAAVTGKPVTGTAAVNLNTASQAELESLSGIGVAKARAIVAYREAHGSFTSVDQLLEVKGIGKALLEKNRARLIIH